MTQHCIEFDSDCELLADIQEPSLSSSVRDSFTSDDLQMDEIFLDRSMEGKVPASSSPLPAAIDKRKSVSLIDVSKIDGFPQNINKTNLPWSAVGSHSSVGKSRDSGYNQSCSLLSMNSESKFSNSIVENKNVSEVIEECDRLKKELEYREVMINTLQESNCELRMKCAKAENKISELRLKCEQHCNCCSTKKVPQEKVDWRSSPNPLFSSPVFPFMGPETKRHKTSNSTPSVSSKQSSNPVVGGNVASENTSSQTVVTLKPLDPINSEEDLLLKLNEWQESQKPEQTVYSDQNWTDTSKSQDSFDKHKDSWQGSFKTWGEFSNRGTPNRCSLDPRRDTVSPRPSGNNAEAQLNQNRTGPPVPSPNCKQYTMQPGGNPLKAVSSSPLPSPGSAGSKQQLSSVMTDASVTKLDLSKQTSNQVMEYTPQEVIRYPSVSIVSSATPQEVMRYPSASLGGSPMVVADNSAKDSKEPRLSIKDSIVSNVSLQNFVKPVENQPMVKENFFESIKCSLPLKESASYSLVQGQMTEGVKDSGQLRYENVGLSVAQKEVCGIPLVDGQFNRWEDIRSRLGNISIPLKSHNDSSNITVSVLQSFNLPPKPAECAVGAADGSSSSHMTLNQSRLLTTSSVGHFEVPSIITKSESSMSASYNSASNPPSAKPSAASLYDCLLKADKYAKELSLGLSRLPTQLEYIHNIGKPS